MEGVLTLEQWPRPWAAQAHQLAGSCYMCFWQQQDFPSLIINLLREMLKVNAHPWTYVQWSSGGLRGYLKSTSNAQREAKREDRDVQAIEKEVMLGVLLCAEP